MQVVNPYTEEESQLRETPLDEIPQLFAKAAHDFFAWRETPLHERVAKLRIVYNELVSTQKTFAETIGREMGKPIKHARIEMERTLEEFDYSLLHAEEWLRPHKLESGTVFFEPLGVTAVISPWNFPLLLPLRGIVPALIAGNSVLFKPSELSSRTALEFEHIFKRVSRDIPFFTIYGGRDRGEALTALPLRLIAFTGSTATGKAIAKLASETLTHTLLELGGLDAAIVLEDADLDLAARECVHRNANNSGQVCNAVKRVYVAAAIYDQLLARMTEYSTQLKMGDPLHADTDLGPLVSKPQLLRAQTFLDDAISRGALAVTGMPGYGGKGYFMRHTILVNVNPASKLLMEEPFGPILPVIPFRTVDEAIAKANDTIYGLTASVWTDNRALADSIAAKLEVGTVGINCHVAGGPGAPWGGTKQSGIGRMKTKAGMREFTNVKFVRG
jgi:acyl-CoA reductase-like NAD-dependent aldehyde dehydrogenase